MTREQSSWRWLSRLADLGTIAQLTLGSSLAVAVFVSISAAMQGLALAVIVTFVLVAICAVLGIGALITWFASRPSPPPEQYAAPFSTVGTLSEQYLLDNAKRYEAQARQFEEEHRKEKAKREEQELTANLLSDTLKLKEELTEQTVKEMSNQWEKLFDDVMASNKKSAKESEEGFKTILAVEAALSPPKEIRGLLDYLEASPADADTLDKRIKSALDLIEAHRQKRFGDLRLEIAKNLPLLPLVGLAPIKPSEDK